MPNSYGSYPYAAEEYAGPPVANSPVVTVDGGNFPTTLLEIAPGYGPNDTAPVWVNIGADVTGIQTRRGRQRILGRFEPGTMNVTLDNKSGRYSPFNGSSPYAALLVPGMPIRFRAIWGAVTYYEFTGFVETWPLTWPSANDSAVTVTAIDSMKFLNLKKATSINAYEPLILVDGPLAWYQFNEPVDASTVADWSGNGHTLIKRDFIDEGLSGFYPQGRTYAFQQPGPLVADPASSFDAGHREVTWKNTDAALHIGYPADFTIEAWVKLSGWKEQVVVSFSGFFFTGLTLGTDIDGNAYFNAPTYGSITTAFNLVDDHWHHLVLTTTTAYVAVIYIDGVRYAAVTGSGPPSGNTAAGIYVAGKPTSGDDSLTMEGSVAQVAVYAKVLTGAQILAHYNAGVYPRQLETTGARIGYAATYASIPASMQALDAGVATVQGATDKWLSNTILGTMAEQSDTEGGDLFIDAAGRLTFFDRYHTSRSPYSSVSLILGDSGTAPEEPYRLESLTVSYDDQDVINEVTVTPDNLAPQTVSDAASQTTYGKRTLTRNSVASTVADAYGQASTILNLNKTPVPRIDSVTVVPTDDPTMLFGPVLGSDLLTRVELRRRPLDGAASTFDQTALIEGIEHRVTKGQWQTTWRMSSIDAIRFGIFNETNFGEVVFAY